MTRLLLAAALLLGTAAPAVAQIAKYGPDVTLEQARAISAKAEIEARKQGWPVAIAIVDTAGLLVSYQRIDDTQTASCKLAIDKAVTAATYRRPTKYFAEALGQGGERLAILTLHGASASEGGLPIYKDGKIIGAIGVSGASSAQDGQVAKAGIEGWK